MPSAFRVLDVPIHPLSMADVLNRIAQVIDSRTPQQIVTVNLDFIRLACKDPRFRAVLSEAAVAVADGMPLVWLSTHWAGVAGANRRHRSQSSKPLRWRRVAATACTCSAQRPVWLMQPRWSSFAEIQR